VNYVQNNASHQFIYQQFDTPKKLQSSRAIRIRRNINYRHYLIKPTISFKPEQTHRTEEKIASFKLALLTFSKVASSLGYEKL